MLSSVLSGKQPLVNATETEAAPSWQEAAAAAGARRAGDGPAFGAADESAAEVSAPSSLPVGTGRRAANPPARGNVELRFPRIERVLALRWTRRSAVTCRAESPPPPPPPPARARRGPASPGREIALRIDGRDGGGGGGDDRDRAIETARLPNAAGIRAEERPPVPVPVYSRGRRLCGDRPARPAAKSAPDDDDESAVPGVLLYFRRWRRRCGARKSLRQRLARAAALYYGRGHERILRRFFDLEGEHSRAAMLREVEGKWGLAKGWSDWRLMSAAFLKWEICAAESFPRKPTCDDEYF